MRFNGIPPECHGNQQECHRISPVLAYS